MEGRGYKLKEFARITNLSRKALLLYEKKKLLVPEYVDEKTGYRYYGTEQVRKAAQLSFLRNLNIPLVHIADILEKKSGLKKYFTRSGKRLELLRQQIKISHALQSIALCDYDDNLISDQIETTVIPQMTVMTLEARSEIKDVAVQFSVLNRFMHQWNIRVSGYPFTIYLKDSSIEIAHYKVCYPVENYTPVQHPDIRCEAFPSVKVAFMYHYGDYDTLYLTYNKLRGAMEQQGLRCTNEYLETYVIFGDKRYTDSSTFLTSVSGILQ